VPQYLKCSKRSFKAFGKKAADSLIDHTSCTCDGKNCGTSFEKRENLNSNIDLSSIFDLSQKSENLFSPFARRFTAMTTDLASQRNINPKQR
jgi:hypothetical protein